MPKRPGRPPKKPEPGSLQERLYGAADLAGNPSTLAERAGIPRRTLGDYLSGASEPTIERLVQIARAADVSLEWLATGEPPVHTSDRLEEFRDATGSAPAALDEDLLKDVVQALEEALASLALELPAEKKGQAVVLLYRYFLIRGEEENARGSNYVRDLVTAMSA